MKKNIIRMMGVCSLMVALHSCTITKPIYTDVNVGISKQELLSKKNLKFKIRKATDSTEIYKATKNIWKLYFIYPMVIPESVYIYFEDDKALKIDRGQGLERRINHRQQVDLNLKKN